MEGKGRRRGGRGWGEREWGGEREGEGRREGAYVVEGDLFQSFRSFLHLEVERFQDSEHASDIVLPKV